MSISSSDLSRETKAKVARSLHNNLAKRAKDGPEEERLDAFIPECDAIATRLETHVSGKDGAAAAHSASAARSNVAFNRVGTMYRHIDNFLYTEATRSLTEDAGELSALHGNACPGGFAHIDVRIIDANANCRKTIGVLRDSKHQATLAAIKFPMPWIDELEAAVGKSEEVEAGVKGARTDKNNYVVYGQSAEEDCDDLFRRLRHYVLSRATRGEVEKQQESKALIAPLTDAIRKANVDAAARKTRKAKKEKEKAATADPAPQPAPVIE